jgi:hypothetical protein
MKIWSLFALLFVGSWAMALETSMVLRSGTQGAGVYAVVEPGLGNVTLYSVEGNQLTKYSSVNFLADVTNLANRPFTERGGIVYSTLRIGDPGGKPTMGDLLDQFPAKPTAKEQANGVKAYRARATEAEDEFWSKEHAYDGVVRGAMGNSCLFLCIPSMHALLLYNCQDRTKGPQLVGFRNYGVDLMVPQVYKSSPTPQEILGQLPADIKEEQKTAIDEALKALAGGGATMALQPSDPWVASGGGDRFVLVDPPNKHMATYEYKGKGWELTSVRNLEVDMLIPTALKSSPDEQGTFTQWAQSRKEEIKAFGIIPDLAYFKALVGQKQIESGKTSDLQANMQADDLVLDYVKAHKLFVYRLNGANNGLELVSMRDYTIDVGLALQDLEFRSGVDARSVWGVDARNALAGHNPKLAMLSVLYALKLDPCLYKEIEKDPRAKDLKALPEWQGTLDTAMKACETKMKELEERRKKAEEERKNKKAGK